MLYEVALKLEQLGLQGHAAAALSIINLSGEAAGAIAGVEDRIGCRITSYLNPESDLASDVLDAEWRHQLLLHHASFGTPVKKEKFEQVLADACEKAGRQVHRATTATEMYYDIKIDEEQYALKSQGDAKIKPGKVDLTKISEAARLQKFDGDSRALRNAFIAYLSGYRAAVQRLIVLRAFVEDNGVLYELVEVPMALFELAQAVPEANFDDRRFVRLTRPAGDTALPTNLGTFRIDMSDGKVQLMGVPIEICTVHARWHLRWAAPSETA
jgi:hypothetical protein